MIGIPPALKKTIAAKEQMTQGKCLQSPASVRTEAGVKNDRDFLVTMISIAYWYI